jgi:hypothetical protein
MTFANRAGRRPPSHRFRSPRGVMRVGSVQQCQRVGQHGSAANTLERARQSEPRRKGGSREVSEAATKRQIPSCSPGCRISRNRKCQ